MVVEISISIFHHNIRAMSLPQHNLRLHIRTCRLRPSSVHAQARASARVYVCYFTLTMFHLLAPTTLRGLGRLSFSLVGGSPLSSVAVRCRRLPDIRADDYCNNKGRFVNLFNHLPQSASCGSFRERVVATPWTSVMGYLPCKLSLPVGQDS